MAGSERKKHKQQPQEVEILFAHGIKKDAGAVEATLRKSGYTVTCIYGRESIDISRRKGFNIIIIDTEGLSGEWVEIIKAIRAQGQNQNTTAIALVERQADLDEAIYAEAGFDEYLEKPIDGQILIRLVQELVQHAEGIKTAQKVSDIICQIAAEPDYQKKVEKLISELPEYVQKMCDAFDNKNLHELKLRTKALRNFGDFTGLAECAEKAQDIEKVIHEQELERIHEKLDELVRLCLKSKLTFR